LNPFVETMIAGGLAGLSSMLFATLVIYTARPSWIPMLVSYAIGALLGAVFLDIMPLAFSLSKNPEAVSAVVLLGILLFFLMEKLVLWRHVHVHDLDNTGHHHSHSHHPGEHGARTGAMVVVGDFVHNFVDGIIIATAFVTNTQMGVVTALAIIAHEIPQEAGDVLVLLHAGYSRRKALAFNLLSSVATLMGGMLACLALQFLQQKVPYLLALAAASMMYVAVADLIPGLHRRVDLKATFWQLVLICSGVASIYLAHAAIAE
jgi:zinc and cadmium transporter